jgi:hypothetical protein
MESKISDGSKIAQHFRIPEEEKGSDPQGALPKPPRKNWGSV